MPIVRSSFTPHSENFKIPKIDFCDVITSVLDTAGDNILCSNVDMPFQLVMIEALLGPN